MYPVMFHEIVALVNDLSGSSQAALQRIRHCPAGAAVFDHIRSREENHVGGVHAMCHDVAVMLGKD